MKLPDVTDQFKKRYKEIQQTHYTLSNNMIVTKQLEFGLSTDAIGFKSLIRCNNDTKLNINNSKFSICLSFYQKSHKKECKSLF